MSTFFGPSKRHLPFTKICNCPSGVTKTPTRSPGRILGAIREHYRIQHRRHNSKLVGSFQESYNTPQAIPLPNCERFPFTACWGRLRGVFQRCVETTTDSFNPLIGWFSPYVWNQPPIAKRWSLRKDMRSDRWFASCCTTWSPRNKTRKISTPNVVRLDF